MLQRIQTPDRPHFIFEGTMWEIEQEYKLISGGRCKTKVLFENINETGLIDPDVGFNVISNPNTNALTITKKVIVEIDDEFAEPVIHMYIHNTGSLVGKTRGASKTKEIEPLKLNLKTIEKLTWEAMVIDTKNRTMASFDEKVNKLIEKIKRLENNVKV